jgi:hypothetical protein
MRMVSMVSKWAGLAAFACLAVMLAVWVALPYASVILGWWMR